jgi:predicted Zn-dependent protease
MEDQIKLFDDYLTNKLSGIERINFERQLTEDQKLRESFEQHRDAVKAIQFAAMKEKMGQIARQERNRNTINLRQAFAIAASLIILAGAWFYISNRADDSSISNEQIFASIHFKDPGLPTLMGDIDHDLALDEFMLQYKLGKYEEAIELGEKLDRDRPYNDTIQFYLAMTLLESGQTEKASSILDELKNPYSIIGQKSQWYLYMISLKNGEVDFALKGIQAISEDEDHIFRTDAIEALDVISTLAGK